MKNIFVLIVAIFTSSMSFAYEQEMLGYKVNGRVVETLEDASPLLTELRALQADEDYEVEVDFCVVYGDSNIEAEDDHLDLLLLAQGFSIGIEGIYGDAGNHMFEVYSYPAGEYLGAFAGVYACN